jgi:hypothetical protein
MRLVLYNFLLTPELKINIIPFKVVPLGSHTQPETFPLPVAVLEDFMWKCTQPVCHDLMGVVDSFKITKFEVEFELREKGEVTRTQIRRIWGCETTKIHFSVKNSFTELTV